MVVPCDLVKEVTYYNMAKRGLGSADQATRTRVARMGGKASRGGGRTKGGQSMMNRTNRSNTI